MIRSDGSASADSDGSASADSDGSASADADGLFHRLGSADGHPTNPRIATDDRRILLDDCTVLTVGQAKYNYPLLLTLK